MKKTFKVVMLASNNNPILGLGAKLRGPLDKILSDFITREGNDGTCKGQHLYIISDEQPKERDWVLHVGNKHIFQYTKGENEYWKKIIVTTDKSLKIEGNCWCLKPEVNGCSECSKQLSQIPESFIEDYIKAYNEGKPITEVELEMEPKVQKLATGEEIIGSESDYNLQIKTNSDNTVIINKLNKD